MGSIPLRYGNGLEMVITNLRDKGDKDEYKYADKGDKDNTKNLV